MSNVSNSRLGIVILRNVMRWPPSPDEFLQFSLYDVDIAPWYVRVAQPFSHVLTILRTHSLAWCNIYWAIFSVLRDYMQRWCNAFSDWLILAVFYNRWVGWCNGGVNIASGVLIHTRRWGLDACETSVTPSWGRDESSVTPTNMAPWSGVGAEFNIKKYKIFVLNN